MDQRPGQDRWCSILFGSLAGLKVPDVYTLLPLSNFYISVWQTVENRHDKDPTSPTMLLQRNCLTTIPYYPTTCFHPPFKQGLAFPRRSRRRRREGFFYIPIVLPYYGYYYLPEANLVRGFDPIISLLYFAIWYKTLLLTVSSSTARATTVYHIGVFI
eukprot:scaffold3823_cov195-Amphora_coffeaeformis.AAC.33